MKQQVPMLNPLDIAILLKIVSYGNESWQQTQLAKALHISQSEVSKSLKRAGYAGLIGGKEKNVRKKALLELLQYGVPYIFPQQPGAIVRGIPTAHSAPPLNKIIVSQEKYVWPTGKGKARGQSIEPLYKSLIEAVQNDNELYEMLALVDALRVGRAREKQLAIQELEERFFNGK